MLTEVVETPSDVARRAADIVCAVARAKPAAILALASGETPRGLYGELRSRVRAGEIDFTDVTAFAIDELYGVAREHPATNASYFARQLGMALRVLHIMNSEASDAAVECEHFAERIERAGGLDLVVLGIGRNGHLAFNEPGSAFDSRARKVVLESSTRDAYVQYFGSLEATPTFGITLGLGDLLAARATLLLAVGSEKAAAVAAALEGPVDRDIPASGLQRHSNATAVLDRAAAGRLRQPRS